MFHDTEEGVLDEIHMTVCFPKKPLRPFFGSGPCVKPKEWSLHSLQGFLMGRSHRSSHGMNCIQEVLKGLRQLFEIPPTYMLALTPASATGAMEMILWNVLGPCPIDIFVWDVFSELWLYDVHKELHLNPFVYRWDSPAFFQKHQAHHDLILTWTGTTSGLWVGHNLQWLLPGSGLVICDATAAAFTTTLPWHLLDVCIFSWQKALGGEASTGIIVLSPKAWDRLQNYTPSWPIPRLFRLKYQQKIREGFFQGETLNTPSLLCLQENLHLLSLWEERGGLSQAIARTQHNFSLVESWLAQQDWIDFLVKEKAYRAQGPVCLAITEERFQNLPLSQQWTFFKQMAEFLTHHEAAFDCINHIDAVPALRIWCGPSIEPEDLSLLFPWLELAFHTVSRSFFHR